MHSCMSVPVCLCISALAVDHMLYLVIWKYYQYGREGRTRVCHLACSRMHVSMCACTHECLCVFGNITAISLMRCRIAPTKASPTCVQWQKLCGKSEDYMYVHIHRYTYAQIYVQDKFAQHEELEGDVWQKLSGKNATDKIDQLPLQHRKHIQNIREKIEARCLV